MISFQQPFLEKLVEEKVIMAYERQPDVMLWKLYIGKNKKGVKFGIVLSDAVLADEQEEVIRNIIDAYTKEQSK